MPRAFVSFFAVILPLAASLVAGPHPSLPPPVVPECFGVNIHFTDPKPGEMEMLAAAGFKWVRMDLTWAATERKKGEYDFSAYDRLVAALDKHKLRALFVLDYGNPLYAEPDDKYPFTSRAGTAEFREAYAKWAVAAVSRYQGKGYLWELWNEPNHAGFWKPKPSAADYIALAKTAVEALRAAGLILSQIGKDAPVGAANPKPEIKDLKSTECLIGPATSTIDLAFLEECFKAGLLESWDAVSVHPYRQSAPETVEEELRTLRLLIRKYAPAGKAIPVISGEWGYSTAYPAFKGKTEAEAEGSQAKYLARMFLNNVANDVALSIWYDWRDDGDDPKEPEHRFGLVRRKYHEGEKEVFESKPAYRAFERLTQSLRGLRFNKTIFASSGDNYARTRIFADAGSAAVIATLPRASRPGAVPHTFSVNVCQGDWSGSLVVAGTDWRTTGGAAGMEVDPKEDVAILKPIGKNELIQVFAAWERMPIDLRVAMTGDHDRLSGGLTMVNPTTRPIRFAVMEGLRRVERDVAAAESFQTPRLVSPGARFNTRVFQGIGLDRKITSPLTVFWEERPINVAQESYLNILNPLSIIVLPPGDSFIPIWVENPSGGAVELHIDARAHRGERHVFPFALGEGKTSDWHLIPMPSEAIKQGAVELFAGAGPLFQPVKCGVPAEWGGLPFEKFRARVSGDDAASAKVTLAHREPPGGPSLSARKSVSIAYTFSGEAQFASITAEGKERFSPPKARSTQKIPSELGLWLYGDAKRLQGRIRVKDSTGQTFQSDGPRIDWKGWRYVTFPMQPTDEKPLAHWGGANDGVIHYPIEWDAIFLLDNASREAVDGEVYLSAPTLIY